MSDRPERGLGFSAERYAFLVEESGMIISTHRPGDWAYTSVNARAYDVMGYRPEELMGVPAYFFFHPDDAEAMKRRTIPAIHAHGTRTFRYRYRHKDGHYLWLESTHRSIRDPDSGELREIVTVSRDLTAQWQAELSAQRLAMVTESSKDLVIFCDESFAITYMNESARRALELAEGNYPPLQEFLSDDCFTALSRLTRQVAERGQNWFGRQSIELVAQRDLALELQELQSHEPDRSLLAGEVYGLIIRDLTEQRQAEKADRERQQELTRAARLMTLGEMATGLAHEINQPLAAILNYSHGALRRMDSRALSHDESRAVMESVARQAQRAASIIKRLRSLVKKTPYQRQRFCVNVTCREVVDFLRHEWRAAGVEVVLHLQEPLADVEADAVQVEQVVLNLLRNSIEAYSSSQKPEKQIELRTLQRSQSVVVQVKDFAGGITPEQREHLFEPYYSTRAEGLGMGLSICRSIAEAHSGSIGVESDGQSYSCFELLLPVANEAVNV